VADLTYFIAITLDGFIADPAGDTDVFGHDDDLFAALARDWPETFPAPFRDALGIADRASRRFDTVVMGRHTYAPALEAGLASPYPHLDQYVVSTTLAPDTSPDVNVVDTDPVALVRALKDDDRQGIWLCGGGQLAAAVADEIDELVLKVNPVAIGAGRPLFAGGMTTRAFRRTGVRELGGGVTMLSLRRREEASTRRQSPPQGASDPSSRSEAVEDQAAMRPSRTSTRATPSRR
jgi:dihydrofolate reductase